MIGTRTQITENANFKRGETLVKKESVVFVIVFPLFLALSTFCVYRHVHNCRTTKQAAKKRLSFLLVFNERWARERRRAASPFTTRGQKEKRIFFFLFFLFVFISLLACPFLLAFFLSFSLLHQGTTHAKETKMASALQYKLVKSQASKETGRLMLRRNLPCTIMYHDRHILFEIPIVDRDFKKNTKIWISLFLF